jgi:branched-chain amino acid transport system substrate-binding protein
MSKMRGAMAALALLLAPSPAPAQTVSDEVVRIGVLTDLSGPYADFAGPGSVLATRMAIEDHNGGRALGKPVEVVSGIRTSRMLAARRPAAGSTPTAST